MPKKSYSKSVFINCPIDGEYTPFFRAIVFSVLRCGHHPRCAVEEDDASEIRLNKILRMITECRLGIHDLSRTEMDRHSRLPRFNMPLELGLFLAAKHFGQDQQKRKACIVFEGPSHSYEAFISDIKGQDIVAHENDPSTMVAKVRNWLTSNSGTSLQGGHALWSEYEAFQSQLPAQCQMAKLREGDLTFGDYVNLVYAWIERED